MNVYSNEVIYDICLRVLKDEAIDVFYIITQSSGGISKIDIQREYQRQIGLPDKVSNSRYVISEAISLLRGTTFVDFYPEGTSQKYYLTVNGEIAAELMGQLLLDKPDLLKTSKIVSKITQKAEG